MASDGQTADAPGLERISALQLDPVSWIVAFAATSVTWLLTSRGMIPFYAAVLVPLFVGAVAGLVGDSPLQSGIVAGVVAIVVGAVCVPYMPGDAQFRGAAWLLGIGLAPLAGWGVGALRKRLERAGHAPGATSLAMASALVIGLIVCLWAPLLAAGFPPAAYGKLPATLLREIPKPGVYVFDDELYRRVFHLMHQGQGYYESFHQAWLGLASKPPLPNSPTAIRLPTLFWIWRVLPADPFLIVPLFLALASMGLVSSAFIAGQLVGARFAPLAATAFAAYAIGVAGTVHVTYVDLPAMSLALAGIALFCRATLAKDRRFLWAAVAVVTFAALMREILIYVAVLAFLTAFLAPRGERLRSAAPWTASLVVFAGGYAAHVYAVRDIVDPGTHGLSYLNGSPAFVMDALTRFATAINGGSALLAALVVLGLAGAIGSRKRMGLPFAVFATLAIVAPLLVMLRIGNPGIDAAGNKVNYWGNLFVPIALALWPAWVLWIRDTKIPAK